MSYVIIQIMQIQTYSIFPHDGQLHQVITGDPCLMTTPQLFEFERAIE